MKKLIALIALAGSVCFVAAQDSAPYVGAINSASNVLAQANTATSNGLAAASIAQVDTNVTTTTTVYTPRRIGDVLVGGAGTGTNAAWVSKGTGTSDWVRVAP